ncbi:MAG: polysaccharide lyase family protein [Acidobacteriota bacterium]
MRTIAMFAAFILLSLALSHVLVGAQEPVKLADDGTQFTLSNGIVSTKIDKLSASLTTLQYKDHELLGPMGVDGFWALPASNMEFGSKRQSAIILDPKTNSGERAIVSVNFTYDGDAKSVPADIEIRYSLARGDSALYLEEILHHRPEYPRLAYPVGRFVIKLNDDIFDWMTVDTRRSMQMITAEDWNHGTVMNMKEARLMNSGVMKGQVEHKYDYAAIQFDTPAYGWSSTKDKIGIWLINPSNEYMSGGPTKLELIAHRDATFTDSLTAPAPATILNVWKGPHYGGTVADVEKGEDWRKTIGPFMLYCNTADSHESAYRDALVRAKKAAVDWVSNWAADGDYPGRSDRGSASGQVVLKDPASKMSNVLVGLTHPDYILANGEKIDWQRDGKYYQFWVRGDSSGKFSIKNIRPGTYTLHAFADGVLGEYSKADITIVGGKAIDLGKLDWQPVRFGRQLWEIGVPDRTAGEFLHGDHYWQWGLYNQYPKDFPSDVNFTVGKSDFRKDWNLMQVPRAKDDTGKSRGDETTWTVSFDLPDVPKGKATLRIALAGIETKTLTLKMNDQQIGIIANLPNTSVIHRDSIRGYWQEVPIPFDASVMKAGKNVLKLIVPAGPVMNGVEYDYLRLELDENRKLN